MPNHRPINVIVEEIAADWDPPHFGAVPYIEAMRQLRTVNDHYGHDQADEVVLRFLSNARTWKGETARRIKAELKRIIEK